VIGTALILRYRGFIIPFAMITFVKWQDWRIRPCSRRGIPREIREKSLDGLQWRARAGLSFFIFVMYPPFFFIMFLHSNHWDAFTVDSRQLSMRGKAIKPSTRPICIHSFLSHWRSGTLHLLSSIYFSFHYVCQRWIWNNMNWANVLKCQNVKTKIKIKHEWHVHTLRYRKNISENEISLTRQLTE
jgi:hypothetical protein